LRRSTAGFLWLHLWVDTVVSVVDLRNS
jgi:hypothetical protein